MLLMQKSLLLGPIMKDPGHLTGHRCSPVQLPSCEPVCTPQVGEAAVHAFQDWEAQEEASRALQLRTGDSVVVGGR